jgi:hypothetical protein
MEQAEIGTANGRDWHGNRLLSRALCVVCGTGQRANRGLGWTVWHTGRRTQLRLPAGSQLVMSGEECFGFLDGVRPFGRLRRKPCGESASGVGIRRLVEDAAYRGGDAFCGFPFAHLYSGSEA